MMFLLFLLHFRLAEECKADPMSDKSTFAKPGVQADLSVDQFCEAILQAVDEVCIPSVLVMFKQCWSF